MEGIEKELDKLIRSFQPTEASERQRNAVRLFVERALQRRLNSGATTTAGSIEARGKEEGGLILPAGSSPLRTYLPDSDLDLVVFVKNFADKGASDGGYHNCFKDPLLEVNRALCDLALSYRGAGPPPGGRGGGGEPPPTGGGGGAAAAGETTERALGVAAEERRAGAAAEERPSSGEGPGRPLDVSAWDAPTNKSGVRGGVAGGAPVPHWVQLGGTIGFGELEPDETVRFEWFKDGEPLPEATKSFFWIQNVSLADEGFYHCSARNGTEEKIWAEAFIQVASAPGVRPAAVRHHLRSGQTLALRAVLDPSRPGRPPPEFRWQRNGRPVGGPRGAAAAYVVPRARPGRDAGTYTCQVFNVAGSAMWEEAVVIISEEE